jgi:hypothetical protein
VAKLRRTKGSPLLDVHDVASDAGVIPFPRQEIDQQVLRDAFDRYRAATTNLATDAPVTADVAEARATLTMLLMRDGWEPPQSVVEQLRRDEELLRRPLFSVS